MAAVALESSKPCRQCGVEHSLADFYSDHRNADGRAGTCKECIQEQRRARRASLSDDERDGLQRRRRAYSAKYRSTEHGRATRLAAVRRRGYPRVETMGEDARNRRRARAAISWAVSHGWRVPGACQACGNVAQVQAHHHHGYEPTHWLDVTWLCLGCHSEEHRGEP